MGSFFVWDIFRPIWISRRKYLYFWVVWVAKMAEMERMIAHNWFQPLDMLQNYLRIIQIILKNFSRCFRNKCIQICTISFPQIREYIKGRAVGVGPVIIETWAFLEMFGPVLLIPQTTNTCTHNATAMSSLHFNFVLLINPFIRSDMRNTTGGISVTATIKRYDCFCINSAVINSSATERDSVIFNEIEIYFID